MNVDTYSVISLFSGYGGIELGLSLALPIKTLCYVENEPYCQRILLSRMRDGSIPIAPIWDDVKTFDGKRWAGQVDFITGGFPCQDISVAGKGAGIKDGARSGLWFEMLRIIGEIRPRYALMENVSALLGRGMDTVLGTLSEIGYDARWTTVRASDVGAPHRRERVFILGISQEQPVRPGLRESIAQELRRGRHIDEGSQGGELAHTQGDLRGASGDEGYVSPDRAGSELADCQGDGIQGLRAEGKQVAEIHAGQGTSGRDGMRDGLWPAGYGPDQYEWEPPRLVAKPDAKRCGRGQNNEGNEAPDRNGHQSAGGRPTQPRLGRNAHGPSSRIHRLRALGNGVVPQQVARAIIELFGNWVVT